MMWLKKVFVDDLFVESIRSRRPCSVKNCRRSFIFFFFSGHNVYVNRKGTVSICSPIVKVST